MKITKTRIYRLSPIFALCSCTSLKHIWLKFHFEHKWTAVKYNDVDRMKTLRHNNIIFQKMILINYTVCVLSVSVCTPTRPNLAPDRCHSNTQRCFSNISHYLSRQQFEIRGNLNENINSFNIYDFWNITIYDGYLKLDY